MGARVFKRKAYHANNLAYVVDSYSMVSVKDSESDAENAADNTGIDLNNLNNIKPQITALEENKYELKIKNSDVKRLMGNIFENDESLKKYRSYLWRLNNNRVGQS